MAPPVDAAARLAHGLGCSHAETREILGGAIDKLRTRLTDTS